jgi:hypothetical protein
MANVGVFIFFYASLTAAGFPVATNIEPFAFIGSASTALYTGCSQAKSTTACSTTGSTRFFSSGLYLPISAKTASGPSRRGS